MKHFVIIAAAGVVAGLLAYAILEAGSMLALNMGGRVSMRISVFVGTLAVIGFLSPALALLMNAEIRRADRDALRRLEERLERLEAGPARSSDRPRETA